MYLFGSLGDSIVAIPALRAVRRQFRDSEVVLLQNFLSDNLVKASEVIPGILVDRYLSYDSRPGKIGKIFGFYRLWRDLRRERFQAAVYLVISERPKRSVLRDKTFFRACGISRLIGFHAFSKEKLYPVDVIGRPARTDHEAVRKLERLQMDGIELRPEEDLRSPLMTFSVGELENTNRWLHDRRSKPASRLIAIAPGCKTQANAWPIGNFIELGRRLIAEENCELLVAGGTVEHEMGEKMIALWGEGINAAGEFSVRESGAVLSRCNFYIGLDTGTTHLAAAVGTPCFAIYGERNNPGHWFPLGNGHSVVFHPVKCAGCGFQDCPLPDHPCMTGVSVDSAWQNLKDFIRRLSELDASETKVISVPVGI